MIGKIYEPEVRKINSMDDFLRGIEHKITKLSLKQQVLFAVLTCEKLLPNYRRFSEQAHWGNIEILEDAIVILYQYLQDIEINYTELDAVYEKINEVSPDTSVFEGVLTSYALDACSAIADSVEFLLSEDQSYLLNVASIARETIDMFIQESEGIDMYDAELETKIAQHIFMQREVGRQHSILDKLAETEIDLPFISAMRDFNNNSGPIIDLDKV